MATLTSSEERGRVVYGREGCAYCHTQQIRFLAADVRRFGAPTETWETKYDYPQLWGTRRIGPDLSRESTTHSRDWQLTHLYNPRLVVRDSVMPPYPWLFGGGPSQPTEDGLDVVAYLQYLGRARELSGFDSNARARYSLSAPVLHPASDPDDLREEVGRGATLFAANCASCHGPAGFGDGEAAASLLPKPANLTAARFSDDRLSAALWNGIPGSSMPPWRQLPAEDLRTLIAFVQSLRVSDAQSPSRGIASLDQGKTLFAANCASCHGDRGSGDGPTAGALAPPPTNFGLKEPTQRRALDVLEQGVPGTAMPPWKSQLDEEQRHALAEFVRSLYSRRGENGSE